MSLVLKKLSAVRNDFRMVGMIIIMLLFVSLSFAQVNVTAPGTLDQAGTTYRLMNDIYADGTAFRITANDVVFDMNGHSITYNNSSSSSNVYGVYIDTGIDRVRITNGVILQGPGKSKSSPAIYIYGASWVKGPIELDHLIIRVDGEECDGILAPYGYSFNGSIIHHVFIESHSTTTEMDGSGAECISVTASDPGGVNIYNNILYGGHRGVGAITMGLSAASPDQTNIYNNLIQQTRAEGSKAPYGIYVPKGQNVHVYNNQIISDNGRGIIIDGWGQGVSKGANNNLVEDNRIDVQYSESASSGAYVENNVYGIRDRYSSGDNTFQNNTVMVTNEVNGDLYGFYIGSDATDHLMKNLNVKNNTIIARKGTNSRTPYVFAFSYADQVSVTDNKYLTDGQLEFSGNVTDLTMSNNVPLNIPQSSPAAPTGLTLTKFLNCYVLQWTNNSEPDVFEYIVYRDGQKMNMSPRGGTFFIDGDVSGSHSYSLSALTLSGTEGPRSSSISTSEAADGWSIKTSEVSIPQGLTVTK